MSCRRPNLGWRGLYHCSFLYAKDRVVGQARARNDTKLFRNPKSFPCARTCKGLTDAVCFGQENTILPADFLATLRHRDCPIQVGLREPFEISTCNRHVSLFGFQGSREIATHIDGRNFCAGLNPDFVARKPIELTLRRCF